MNDIYLAQKELLECYVNDINTYKQMFFSIKMNDEVTILNNNVFLITDDNDNIIALYGRNTNGFREYVNISNIQSIKFCRTCNDGIFDASSVEVCEMEEC